MVKTATKAEHTIHYPSFHMSPCHPSHSTGKHQAHQGDLHLSLFAGMHGSHMGKSRNVCSTEQSFFVPSCFLRGSDLRRPPPKTMRLNLLLFAIAVCGTSLTMSSAFQTGSLPALNLPALQAKRAISPSLRELSLFCAAKEHVPEKSSPAPSRRQALQLGIAAVGGVALAMSSSAGAEELSGYKLVDIFRVDFPLAAPCLRTPVENLWRS